MRKHKKFILVTGGAGYIGSHMTRLLEAEGHLPLVFDNLSTGNRRFVSKGVPFIKGDLCRPKDIEKLFQLYDIQAVINFAGSIVVPESVVDPLKYYYNNIYGMVNLLEVMRKHKVNKIIFSSTAAVYGNAKKIPITEQEPLAPSNPYARTKLMIEQILEDARTAYGLNYVVLRYFNVAGSHPLADIGINLTKPTHLVPNVMKVASGRKPYLEVFGNDYETADGTCIRDYIYVMDLCRAHLDALKALEKGLGSDTFNLGCGSGFSVNQVVDQARKLTGKPIKVVMRARRKGDVPALVASSRKAWRVLKWKPQASLKQILSTAWDWENSRVS